MLKRTITGMGLVIVVTGFFFLRLLSLAYFEILIWLFTVIGSFEVARAFGDRITSDQKWSAVVLSALFVPLRYLIGEEGALIASFFAVAVQLALSVVTHEKTTIEGTALAVLACMYPAIFLVPISSANLMAHYSTVALLMIFVVSPLADTGAYLIGSLLKGPKLCPKISPKKTISGAIGGVVGGVIVAFAVYFFSRYALSIEVPAWWFCLIVGVVSAVLTEFGDLVESIIKRKVGIKDMGKLLPGHGGVMDRIDGISFAAPFVYLCFKLLTLL